MKKLNLLILLSTSALFTGCSLFTGGDSSGTIPYNASTADVQHYETIGEDFKDYFTSDASLTTENETNFNSTLTLWKTSGSTWDTYETLIGEDDSGPYVVYYENDPNLTDVDKTSREINVDSWELNLITRLGNAPWNNGGNE